MTTSNTPRTRIRVVRSDGREWPTLAIAYRELIGTEQELGGSEHQRIRARIRQGEAAPDRHGFIWKSIGGTVAEAMIAWTDFTFGVELEVTTRHDRYALRTMLSAAGVSDWNIIGDASLIAANPLQGLELVSPVLRGEAGLATVRTVCEVMKANGVTVNSSCGMHVHIGARGMKPSRLRRIARAFLNTEEHFDSIVAPSRRDNRYAQSNHRQNNALLGTADNVRTIAEAMNGGYENQHYTHYRYYKLNFQSYLRHGTIEFRQHAGTVEADKACAWVRLIAGFCAWAASVQEQAPSTTPTFEQFIAASTDAAGQSYMTARRAKFQTALARRAA